MIVPAHSREKNSIFKKTFFTIYYPSFSKMCYVRCIYSIECELWHCTKSAKNKINIRAKLSLNPANYHFFLFLFYFRLLLKMVNTKAPFFSKASFQKQPPEVFYKKAVFFPAKFTGKHLGWSLFKVLKRNSSTGVFCEYCQMFKNTCFKEHLIGCFYSLLLWCFLLVK